MALSSVTALPTATANVPSTEGSKVKQERPDDDEINALAAKMVEANKAKMASTPGRTGVPGAPGPPGHPGQTQMAGANQPAILNFLTRNGQNGPPVIRGQQSGQTGSSNSQNSFEKPPCDADSVKMHFGWVTLGKNHIPYIVRYGSEKYCAVRMVEMKLLSKYLSFLHADIYSCTCIRSYYITDAEARLLNDINVKHCDFQFGRDPFTTKDLVVRLQDADEFYTFLDVCYNKLQNNSDSNKCGFIRIDGESVVPYILRNGTKYVPVFYFEGEISSLFQKSETLEGWDLAYLKFCCKVQGIRAELFEKDNCSVISLEDIKGYFPADTNFEDYWPRKVVDRQLLVASNKSDSSCAQWTLPSVSASACGVPTQSPSSVSKVPSVTSAAPRQAAHTSAYGGMNPAMTNGWSGLVGGQATYPTSQSSRMAQAIMHNVSSPHYQTAPAQVRSSVQAGLTSGVPGSTHPYYQQQGSMQMGMAGAPSVQPPPPLVRVTGAQPSVGRSNAMYSNASPLTHMMNLQVGQHSGQMPPPPQPQTQAPAQPQSHAHYHANKLPPPLVSVNGVTPSSRYPYVSTNGIDVIDLSSSPQSPQMGQRHVSNGKPAPVDSRHKLIQIPDCSTSGSHMPYKVQKALVEGRMVPCINAKPYVYTELLMTLTDLTTHFFPSLPVNNCRQGLQEILRIELFRGNRQQMQILKEAGKCQSTGDILPLVQVKDVMQFMPQMKYMFNSRRTAEEPPTKTKRTS